MKMNLFIFLLPLLLQNSASPAKSIDYYWKDYFGDIPEDAYAGGAGVNNETKYYVAQALRPSGLYPAWLRPGDKSIMVTDSGAKHSTLGMKVLCSLNPQKLTWLSTAHNTFNTDVIGKHLVPGGGKHDKLLHIGRVWREGEVLVGNIYDFGVEGYWLYCVQNNREFYTDKFQVLVYDDDKELMIDPRSGVVCLFNEKLN